LVVVAGGSETIRTVDEDGLERRAKHRLPKGLLPISEAALTVCFKTGMSGAVADGQCNQAAGMLAQLCTLYYVSKDKQAVRALSAEDLHGGTFVDSGRHMTFTDGRPPLERIFVNRSALRAAIATIRRASKR
jgi:hypothetical protein